MPRTGAPPTMGETATTGAGVRRSASAMPSMRRMVPIETTGLLGGSSTTSASRIASRTPGPGFAVSLPTRTNPYAGSSARYRIHHSWKWMAVRSGVPSGVVAPVGSSTTTCVSARSSDIGSRRTRGCQRSHRAAVTSVRV